MLVKYVTYLYTELHAYTELSLYDFGYYSLLYSLTGSIVACATFTNSLSSALSSCDTYLIRSVTLLPHKKKPIIWLGEGN